MIVTLSPDELVMGVSLATSRVLNAIQLNRANSHGFTGSGWAENIEGYCAELAVAKALGLYYSGGSGFKAADVGANIQVRWASKPNYRLIVRAADNPAHIYILVTGEAPTYKLVGFMRGSEAQKPQYLDKPDNNRPAAWFVPQSDLLPMENLNA